MTHSRIKGFPGDTVVKSLLANVGEAGDMGLIPGSRRSPGDGNDNPLQSSCLENPMDRGAWHGIAESDVIEYAQKHPNTRIMR